MNMHVRTLSPQQKAWETRRAKLDGRVLIETRKAEAAAPVVLSPLQDAKMVELWLDRHDVGCGYRRYVVLEIGYRSVLLFSAAKLATVEVDRREFDRHAREVMPKAKAVVAIMQNNIKLADRINDRAGDIIISDGGRNAARAVERLS